MSADALSGWTETASIGTLDAATETITGLPSTITELYMAWDDVSTSVDSPSTFGVRLGTSGGIKTSGYKNAANQGYDGSDNLFTSLHHLRYWRYWQLGCGCFMVSPNVFWNINSNTWVYNAIVRNSDGAGSFDYDVIQNWAGRSI